MNPGSIIYIDGPEAYLEVVTIGYKQKGESVILLLKTDGGSVLWSMAIDCYKLASTNVTNDLLAKANISVEHPLDVLSISHPDTDHIEGMDEIVNLRTGDITKFLLPDFMRSGLRRSSSAARELEDKIRQRFNNRKLGNKNTLFLNRTLGERALIWSFVIRNEIHYIQLQSFLPTDNLPFVCECRGIQYTNDYSLFTVLTIDNEYSFIFTGDCTDYELATLDDDICDTIGEVRFIKIPHHGSSTASNLRSMILNKTFQVSNYSFSACAFSRNVTKEDVLQFYAQNTHQLSVTGSVRGPNRYDFGIIRHIFEFPSGNYNAERSAVSGNAILDYGARLDAELY